MASGKHRRTPRGVVSHRRGRQLWRYELKEKSRGFLRSCRVVGGGEDLFVWLGVSRGLSRDYEHLSETAEAMIYSAMSRIHAT